MAFSTASEDDGDMMSEINMIPLIDVMLVLLIVFMITVPVMTHSVQVRLPQASSEPLVDRPEAIQLTIEADGQLIWNQTPISSEELASRFAEVASLEMQPDLHLRGDQDARYAYIAQALAMAQRAGIQRLSFVTDPS
jgi:biopolymer transport protein ExbD